MIAGGGTGGHAVPAIAIGQALVQRGHAQDSIHFVGSRRGIEARLVPAAGFGLTLLPGRGISRSLSPATVAANLGAVAGLVSAFFQAIALLRRLRPAVVVVVGGYASAPAALAAALWRVPMVVAEQNAVPGLANRLAGRFAKASAVSFDGTPLPRAVVTGNPVRPEVVQAAAARAGRRAARAALGVPEQVKLVAVSGGSLGARRINEAVLGLADQWADRSDICIYHVVGKRDYASISARRPPSRPDGLDYRQIEFEDRMDQVLLAADAGVQRAGASTVAELTAIGLPSVLVPLPGAPGDHQTQNARRLADAGAAVLVPDPDCDAFRLAAELDRMLADPSGLEQMAAAARRLGRPGAAAAVAELVESVAGGVGRA